MITRADVDAAAVRISGRVRRTPVVELDAGTAAGPVWVSASSSSTPASPSTRWARGGSATSGTRHDLRIAVEYGAAAGFAALVSKAYQPAAGERLAIVLCGANTDPSDR